MLDARFELLNLISKYHYKKNVSWNFMKPQDL